MFKVELLKLLGKKEYIKDSALYHMNFHHRQGNVLLLKDVKLMNLLFTAGTRRHSGNFALKLSA